MTGYRRTVQRGGWRPRPGDGFGTPSINDLAALPQNRKDFESRLREIGFFRDLSDAFVTQTIAPRYGTQLVNHHRIDREDAPGIVRHDAHETGTGA